MNHHYHSYQSCHSNESVNERQTWSVRLSLILTVSEKRENENGYEEDYHYD